MNRLFSDRWQSFSDGREIQRVQVLEPEVSRFWNAGKQSSRWHLDMHTAIRDCYHSRFGILPFRTSPYDEEP